MRTIAHRYLDPLDEIWLAAAKRLGLTVKRSDAVYAAYDGSGTLTLSERQHFDADDSLAQLIFHELCHALVSGESAMRTPDWGLCNTDGSDLVREHACHRLQAALSARHGLRGLFAVTTDHRAYWDALPDDPLAQRGADDDPAIELARAAWLRARRGVWAETLEAALAATQAVAAAVRPFAAGDSLWRTTRALHRTGFPLHVDAEKRCGDCAWLHMAGPGTPAPRCRMTRSAANKIALRVETSDTACERFEPKLGDAACAECGACCREGFDLVPVRAREPMAQRHPTLLKSDRHGLHVPRPDGRCVALAGDGSRVRPYRCTVYADRPRACAEFELGGDACLEARRRVGISR